MTDIAGVVMLAGSMFGLGFLTCLYLVFGAAVWLGWGRE
jgi:hypothetical protein